MSEKTKTAAAEDSVRELIHGAICQLLTVAEVLHREHVWMKTRVDHSREIEGDYSYEVEHGHMTPEEAEERRAEDNLILKRQQVDLHLNNLALGVMHMRDVADALQTMFIGPVAEVRL